MAVLDLRLVKVEITLSKQEFAQIIHSYVFIIALWSTILFLNELST